MASQSKDIVTLADALEQIQLDKIIERQKGLENLKEILSYNRAHPSLQKLSERSIHAIFEALFRVNSSERASYVRGGKSTTKAASAGRLALGASVLRLAVALFSDQVKRKTVKALLGHIIQTLPTAHGGYCEPLALEYLKSLNIVLAYPPHVEHFDDELWLDIVDFCLDGLRMSVEDDAANSASIIGRPQPLSFRSQSSAFLKTMKAESIENVVELLGCLRSLVLPFNSPLLERAENILSITMTFLQRSPSITSGHHAAIQSINAALTRIASNSGSLVHQAMPDLISLTKTLWPRTRTEYLMADELLICMMHLQAFLLSVVETTRGNQYLIVLESLLQVMITDYCSPRKEERGHLELLDLGLNMRGRPTIQVNPMQAKTFYLRRVTTKSERSWAELHFISLLVVWIDRQKSYTSRSSTHTDDDLHLSKRRKTSRTLGELLVEMPTKTTVVKTCWLQIMAFIANEHELAGDDVSILLENITIHASDSNSDVASWALLTMAGCAYQSRANGVGLKDYWMNVWHSSLRRISSLPFCRAACQVLQAVLSQKCVTYLDVAESIEVMWASANFNGPGLLCDSAVDACLIMLELKALHDPGASQRSHAQMVTWICTKWVPSSFENKVSSDQLRRAISPKAIYAAILRASWNNWIIYPSVHLACLSHMGQAWVEYSKHSEMLEYLQLLEPGTLFPHAPKYFEELRSLEQVQPEKKYVLQPALWRYLKSETDKTLEMWNLAQNQTTINGDMIHVVFSFCLIGLMICNNESCQSSAGLTAIAVKLHTLAINVIKLSFNKHIYHRDRVNALLDSVYHFLPLWDDTKSIHHVASKLKPVVSVLQFLAEFLEEENKLFENHSSTSQSHGDVFDVSNHSLNKHMAGERLESDEGRTGFAEHSSKSFFASISSFISLVARIFNDTSTTQILGFVPTSYIRHIISLPESEFLSSLRIMKDLTNTTSELHPSDAEALIVHLAHSFLEPYKWSRFDGALCLCLDIMIGTIALWTDHNLESLAEAAADIYTWFTQAAAEVHVLSSNVQKSFADLLYKLLDIRPDFMQAVPQPSVRTTLFGVLQCSEVDVKYCIAQRLPMVFSSFVVNQHDAIFDDVHNNLPNDVDWTEGVAIRILAHTRLGCAWTSLLRRCLYHIFEVAENGGIAEPFALLSIQRIVKTLEFSSAQELFRLFCPQLLYTWLTTQSIRSIPYKIFDYDCLRDLLIESKAEVLSQVIMRGGNKHFKDLEELIGTRINVLLRDCFPQALAYSLAKDVVTVSEGGGASHEAESCIKDLLGKEEYLRLVEEKFHMVIGHLFLRLDKEDQVDRVFAKRGEYETPNSILRVIKGISSSDTVVPTGQQPDFKPRAVFEAIERACRRVNDASKKGNTKSDVAQKTVLNIWTPLLFLAVSRLLLNDIHPVLASSHICHTVRKLRLLVCLADRSVLSGYPLEMLLHALRPFLTEKLCADDAIGLFQYLLDNGKDSLCQNMSFVSGLCLTTFLKLQHFLKSKQDSTTQESDHLGTLSKARAFHGWLSRYLDTCTSQNAVGSQQRAFQIIMDAARRISNPVNAFLSSPESQLLLAVLDQLRLPKPFLNNKILAVCFQEIFGTFSAPESFRDDVLGREEDAKKYHLAVWTSLQYQHVSKKYGVWAAKVLGRSFGFDGELARDVYAESKLRFVSTTSEHEGGWLSSKTALINILIELLQSQSSRVVGYAEYSLQNALHSYSGMQENIMLMNSLPASLIDTFSSPQPLLLPNPVDVPIKEKDVLGCFQRIHEQPFDAWIRDLAITVMTLADDEPLFKALPATLHMTEQLSEHLFPFIIHITLTRRWTDGNSVRTLLSEGFQTCFEGAKSVVTPHIKVLLNAVIYLRKQSKPQESTFFDRNKWLFLDYYVVAAAAANCNMPKTALLFIDIARSIGLPRSEAEGSHGTVSEAELLPFIFSSLDEPDSFYGVEQKPDLDSLINRHAFEGNGVQSLLFRSAQLDSHSRRGLDNMSSASGKLVKSLARVNLNCVTRDLAISQGSLGIDEDVTESAITAALKLGQWDLPVPSTKSNASILYHTFQSAFNAIDVDAIGRSLDNGLSHSLEQFRGFTANHSRLLSAVNVMTSLTEIHELLASRDTVQAEEVLTRLKDRRQWMGVHRIDSVTPILTSRAAIISILRNNPWLQSLMHIVPQDLSRIEVDLELCSSSIFRTLGALQESLSIVTYLSDQIEPYQLNDGIKIDGAVKREIANVLWDRGEYVPSIQVLREIVKSCDFQAQTLHTGLAETLATLGQRVSYARLENSGDIVEKYLWPAMNELQKNKTGPEVAHVFHEYASYCHSQLINTDNVEEFRRSERFMRQKAAEIKELKAALSASKTSREKANADKAMKDAQKWYFLDKQEYDRIHANREDNLRQSLISYLQTLAASDVFNTDTIKFTALWYEFADSENANSAVKSVIDRVPSRKFAPLMNQLSSRLQQTSDNFQDILSELIERVCHDHPYHGMNHVSAGSKTSGGNDSQARSRNRGAMDIAARLANNAKTTKLWLAFAKSNDLYMRMAKFKNDDLKKANQRFLLRKIDVSRRVERDIPGLRVPPITMSIGIREDFDYSSVPTVVGFKPEMSILGGLSAPKLLTAIDSTGKQHKQLFKGGSDDLRQDAIMEQVFGQVTDLLRLNKSTRQRKLGIRTYKVVPLDATSGAIEFVQPTTSLLDFLNPAHQLYHPTEYNWKTCRDKIEKGQDLPQAARIKIFQDIKLHFTPVLRHFFFERFKDPNDWFDRRLAYTRSTAAISILGHILGLGDRHCQNILLDTSTGEVVHIDLGVAFEAGRILPKPETVPFRLTRDIIDGFGVLKTEGVFRRCCEFTLEALRQNKDTIMTLLNVLRYDPLYSWSVSPLRAKRLQEEQQLADGSAAVSSKPGTRRSSMIGLEAAEAVEAKSAASKNEDEGSEADRALSVVERKLAAGLSVTATVNELIQQATDDKNLAVLFHGWAAYA